MKKLLLVSLLSVFAISCSVDTDQPIGKQNEEQVTNKVTLVVSEDYTSTKKTWDVYSDRFERDEFFVDYPVNKPVYPTSEVTAHFISKETIGQYKAGDVVKSINVNIGTNDFNDLPRLKYDVVVTNYKKYKKDQYGYDVEDLEWFKYADAIETLPNLTEEMYLFSKTSVDFNTETVAEVKLKNHYSMIRVLKYYISVSENNDLTPYEIRDVEARTSGDEKANLKSDNSLYYYIYTRKNTSVVFKPKNSNNNRVLQFNTMSVNNVYVIIPYIVYHGELFSAYKEFSFDDNMLQ